MKIVTYDEITKALNKETVKEYNRVIKEICRTAKKDPQGISKGITIDVAAKVSDSNEDLKLFFDTFYPLVEAGYSFRLVSESGTRIGIECNGKKEMTATIYTHNGYGRTDFNLIDKFKIKNAKEIKVE